MRWFGMYSRLDELHECRAVYCKKKQKTNNGVIILDLTYELKSLNGNVYTCGLWYNGIKADLLLLIHSTEKVWT